MWVRMRLKDSSVWLMWVVRVSPVRMVSSGRENCRNLLVGAASRSGLDTHSRPGPDTEMSESTACLGDRHGHGRIKEVNA